MLTYVPDGAVLTEYFWDRSELSVIQGPIGSGTSTASCHKIWAIASEQAPDHDGVRRTRWLVVRNNYRELRKTTIKTWRMWFPEQVWGEMQLSEPMTHHLKMRHPSGDGTVVDCEVIFIAIPDAETAEQVAASFEITGFFVNEGQFQMKEVVDELLSRCGRYPSMMNGPGATWYGGFIDLNAPTEGHWIPYMRGDMPLPADWSEEQKGEYQIPFDDKKDRPAWKFFVQPPGLVERKVEGKIVYQPNPNAENQKWLKKSYMEQVRGKRKEWIDRRVLNKVGLYLDGKAVYPDFSEHEHVAARDLVPVAHAKIFVGLDFGREPSAVFCQCVNERWTVLSELPGDNESAEKFAPRVKRHLAQKYPGMEAEFWGDPRGADKTQSVETTAYDIFQAHGMRVFPATTDNNPEMRRSAVGAVLNRRNALQVSPGCMTLKVGLAGGYHYPKIKGTGMYSERPRKNVYSHTVEAFENAILGGGEGEALVMGPSARRSVPSTIRRHSIRDRRRA
jgi:hypothetical protein